MVRSDTNDEGSASTVKTGAGWLEQITDTSRQGTLSDEELEEKYPDVTMDLEADTVQSGTVGLEDEELRTRYENAVSEDFEFHQVSDQIWEVTTNSDSTYTVVPSDAYSGSPDFRFRDVPVDKCLIALALHSPDAREQLRFALLESSDSVVSSDTVDELNEKVARIAELERQVEELVDQMDEDRQPVVQLFNMLEGDS